MASYPDLFNKYHKWRNKNSFAGLTCWEIYMEVLQVEQEGLKINW